ncbi:MAG: hypothetical protein ACP5N1_00460 [Candidatus Woesearchaeota archaeon]
MQTLEPPEVPLDLLPEINVPEQKKEGFFKRLFSKKSNQEIDVAPSPNPKKDLSEDKLPELNLSKEIMSNNFDINSKNSKNNDFKNKALPKFDLSDFELPTDINSIDSDINAELDSAFATLPKVLPNLNEQLVDKKDTKKLSDKLPDLSKISKSKSRGKLKKGSKRSIKKIDESSQFDWTREVKDQEILIHDSNRFNQDINILLNKTDAYVDETNAINNDNSIFASEHQDVILPKEEETIPEFTPIVKPMQVEESRGMPTYDQIEHVPYTKMFISHKKLRSTLEKYIKNKKLFNNKQKVMELFKQYDLAIEKIIEDKEAALIKKKKDLDTFELHLKNQEKEIKSVHSYVLKLDSKLKDRENNLNELIALTVEKELTRRLKIEKKKLSDELKKVAVLNSELKKKLKLVDDDSIRFKKEHNNMRELERQKLTQMQSLYEQKLNDLSKEKSEFESDKSVFEERRKQALVMIERSDSIAKELSEIDKIKADLELSKKEITNTRADMELSKRIIDKEYNEDKELKHAIENAEIELIRERENLDKLVFSKYLDNKLKSIKPEYLAKQDDWRTELRSHPLYEQIALCRKTLSHNNIADAKSLYNAIRKSYDSIDSSRKEKEALYTAIRELYNDIQLKIVESQLNA